MMVGRVRASRAYVGAGGQVNIVWVFVGDEVVR